MRSPATPYCLAAIHRPATAGGVSILGPQVPVTDRLLTAAQRTVNLGAEWWQRGRRQPSELGSLTKRPKGQLLAVAETPYDHEAAKAECEAEGQRYHRPSRSCFGGPGEGGPSRSTARATPSPEPRTDLEIVEQGFTYFPGSTIYVQFAVVFENPNLDTWVAERTSVNITWYKADGTVAGSSSEFLDLGLPGQRVALGGVAFGVVDPTEMEVQWRSNWTAVDFIPGAFAFEGVNTTPDQFGGVTTTGNIRRQCAGWRQHVR